MSLTFEEAKEIAKAYIEANQLRPVEQTDGNKLILFEEETIEKVYGWYFFSAPSKLIETGDFRYTVMGNVPFLVEKESGNLIEFGTPYPIEHYIEEYEKNLLK
jgi:hypothetical protein